MVWEVSDGTGVLGRGKWPAVGFGPAVGPKTLDPNVVSTWGSSPLEGAVQQQGALRVLFTEDTPAPRMGAQ